MGTAENSGAFFARGGLDPGTLRWNIEVEHGTFMQNDECSMFRKMFRKMFRSELLKTLAFLTVWNIGTSNLY